MPPWLKFTRKELLSGLCLCVIIVAGNWLHWNAGYRRGLQDGRRVPTTSPVR